MFLRSLGWAAILCSLAACGQPSYLTIRVLNPCVDAVYQVALDISLDAQSQTYVVPQSATQLSFPYSVGIEFPSGATGSLLVNARALDSSGTTLATGSSGMVTLTENSSEISVSFAAACADAAMNPEDLASADLGTTADLSIHDLALSGDATIANDLTSIADLGPSDFSLPSAWTNVNFEGGDIRALVQDPQTSAIFYAGTVGGGLYKSINSGANWFPLEYGLTDRSIYSLAVHPTNSNIVYAGTAKGLFRSTDAGQSWNRLSTPFDNRTVESLVIDPVTPNTMYAGADDAGVYKSTNGGTTWLLKSTGLPGNTYRQLLIDPTDHLRLFANVYTQGLYRTSDGAENWSLSQAGIIFRVAINQIGDVHVAGFGSQLIHSSDHGMTWSGPATGLSLAFALVTHPNNPMLLYATNGLGTYLSTDGGVSYAAINGTPMTGIAGLLLIDRSNATHIFAATNGYGVMLSTDAGIQFSPRNTGLRATPIAELAIASSGSPPPLFIATSLQGVFRSGDGAATYSARNSGIIDNGLIMSLAAHPAISDVLLASTAAGVYKTINGGTSWTSPSPFNFTRIHYSLATPTLVYALSNTASVFKSTNGGDNWNSLPFSAQILGLAPDPVSDNVIYLGLHQTVMHRSIDYGANFSPLPNSPQSVSAILIEPTNPARVYAAGSGGIYVSLNSGGVWSLLDATLNDVWKIVRHPNSSAVLYVATEHGVFKSNNSGASWDPAGLTNYPVRSLVIDPATPTTVYASGPGGLWKSTTGGQ